MEPILAKLMEWLLNTMAQDDEGMIRNTVFCFGVMIYKNPQAMAPYFQQCLQYVHMAFDKVESLEAKDNIVSTLFKLI